jgi:hypothetical protein
VRVRFGRFPFVNIVPGAVPDTLDSAKVDKVALLSLDMNCAAPEVAAARHFWPKMSPGGMIVLDDYGFTVHVEQRRAFDSFAAEQGVPLLALPTGQGLILKPPGHACATSSC